ncbi:hypothetical protein V8F06_007879, partial [Rhypophila decipiens]
MVVFLVLMSNVSRWVARPVVLDWQGISGTRLHTSTIRCTRVLDVVSEQLERARRKRKKVPVDRGQHWHYSLYGNDVFNKPQPTHV